MIVVSVELHSARTGEVTELARMLVDNQGGTDNRCDYRVRTLKGRSRAQLDQATHHLTVQREALVRDHDRKRLHVWNLVAKALNIMGYGT